jgi:DNA-binding transcriptional MerR regulator
VRYRVEQLAAACDVSVDTVRYYQSRGLLPPPEREGRVAWYDDRHVDRIADVRRLQRRGLTLAAIERVVDGELARPDVDLVAAIAEAQRDGDDATELLTLDAFSQRSGVPASLIQAVEREGIRLARRIEGQDRYAASDIRTVRAALTLLEFGLPLGELLALARRTHEAMLGLAERAVQLFDEHVRKPIRDTASDDDTAAAELTEAFRTMLPSVTELVASHFRRVLLATAQAHLERVGADAEVRAAREESERMERAGRA